MIRTAKKTARKHLLENYKYYLLPTFISFIFSTIGYIINSLVLAKEFSHLYNSFVLIIAVILLFVLNFLVYPLNEAVMYKVANSLESVPKSELFKEIKNFLKLPNILKILAISFIPEFVDLAVQICKLKFSFLNNDFATMLLITLTQGITVYCFTAVSYYFIFENLSVKKSIISSFAFMSNNIFKLICFTFSFFGWIILMGVMQWGLGFLIYGQSFNADTIPTLFTIIFRITGYGGIGFYLFPFMTLSEIYFIKELSAKKGNPSRR